jgi:hypothetical protein
LRVQIEVVPRFKSFFNRKDAKGAKKHMEKGEDERIIEQETTKATEKEPVGSCLKRFFFVGDMLTKEPHFRRNKNVLKNQAFLLSKMTMCRRLTMISDSSRKKPANSFIACRIIRRGGAF